MPKDIILTPEGLDKLQTELEFLQTDKRQEVAERIKEAREFGDITENSEYDDAKNEQAMLEAKIAQLEDKLRSASVIDSKELGTDQVRVGSIVHVKDEGGHAEQHRQCDDGQDDHLTPLVSRPTHSTRSFITVWRFPLLTTQPSRLIEYGYWTSTVTSEPIPHEDEQETMSFDGSRSLAEERTWLVQAPTGSAAPRETAPTRAPARPASVIVT